MKILFLILNILALQALATPRMEIMETLSIDLSPTPPTPFCSDFIGSWSGSCDIIENGTATTIQEIFSIRNWNNCVYMSIGNEGAHIEGIKEEIRLSPAIGRLGLPPEHRTRSTQWNWTADRAKLQVYADSAIKNVRLDQPRQKITVTGEITLTSTNLIRHLESTNRKVSCSYTKLPADSDIASHATTSLTSFFEKEKLSNNPPLNKECTDFSGQWKGACVFETGAYTSNWSEDITVEQDGCEAVSFEKDSWTRMGSINHSVASWITTLPDTQNHLPLSDTLIKQVNWNEKKTKLITHVDEIFSRDNDWSTDNLKTEGEIFIRADGKLIRKSFPHGNCYGLCVYEKVQP